MALPQSPFLKIKAVWPVTQDEVFDPTKPSPWAGVPVPSTPNPLQPTISILFSHGLSADAVANDNAVSNYFFLTSLTDPTALNITQFEAMTWDSQSNLLTFRPSITLNAGQTYQATIRNTLSDFAGRKLPSSFSWDFEVDPALYQGLPVPVPFSPPDQSVILSPYIPLIWGVDPNYTTYPSGQSLYFDITIFGDSQLTNLVWFGSIMSPFASIPSSGSAFNLFEIRPAFAPSGIVTPNTFWWSVRSRLTDVSGNVISASLYSPAVSYYLDNTTNSANTPTSVPIPDSYPGTLQADPLTPPQGFFVTGVLPGPGYVTRIQMPGGLATGFPGGAIYETNNQRLLDTSI